MRRFAKDKTIRMNWKKLLYAGRYGQDEKPRNWEDDLRTEFQRDYDRLIFSSPFRRLQNKTQVFPLPGSVFVHNRLTHSLEVSSVGRSLGNKVYDLIQPQLSKEEKKLVREIGTVVATACLAHDLGNPPFGHSGEKAISHFFAHGAGQSVSQGLNPAQYQDLCAFEGNANLLRLLTHRFEGRRKGGYALTFASLGAMIKYPFDSSLHAQKKKFGYFQTETAAFSEIVERLGIPVLDSEKGIYARHPLVYLVEAADDISYLLIDLEDAHKLGILSGERIHGLFRAFYDEDQDAGVLQKIDQTLLEVTDANEQIAFLRAMVIGKLVRGAAQVFAHHYAAIMQGSYTGKLLDGLDELPLKALQQCATVALKEVYKHPSVVKVEISGYNVLGFLLETFFRAVMNPAQDYSKMLLSLIPLQYRYNGDDVYEQVRSVVDFVSGMTDVYAVDLFKQIKGLEL